MHKILVCYCSSEKARIVVYMMVYIVSVSQQKIQSKLPWQRDISVYCQICYTG